ncbi:hypothetical protein AAHE18_15G289400 [Arachis hypogaea]
MATKYKVPFDLVVLYLNAFEEGGVLHGKKVYLFGCTEPQQVCFKDVEKVILVPIIVARETEEIIPMKQMKMDWIPYISSEDRWIKYEYCLPYFYHPLKEDELEQSTEVQILFPTEPKPVFCSFDWKFNDLEEFSDELIKDEELSADRKHEFKDFVKEKVREEKKANKEAREARRKVIEEMSEETKVAFKNMRVYKFYPVQSPDSPPVSKKCHVINRYYGKAHEYL